MNKQAKTKFKFFIFFISIFLILSNVSAGDLIVSTNQTLCGTQTYDNVIINNSAIVQICVYNGSLLSDGTNQTGMLIFNVSNFTLDSGSIINGTAKGYAGNAAGSNGKGPGGGIYNGAGGNTYGSTTNVTQIGSSGGSGTSGVGGAGGGYVKINATGKVNISGSINANGLKGGSDAGGGSGGGIWIITNTLSGNGVINSSGGEIGSSASQNGGGGGSYGGSGGSNSPGDNGGSGGGGGRIYVQSTTDTSTITFSATGRIGTSSRNGGAGTIRRNNNVIIDNQGVITSANTILNETTSLNNLTIMGGGKLLIDNNITVTEIFNITSGIVSVTFLNRTSPQINTLWVTDNVYDRTGINVTKDFIIYSGGVFQQDCLSPLNIANDFNISGIVNHTAGTTTNNANILINTKNLNLFSTGTINVNGLGYIGAFNARGNGPGGGAVGGSCTGAGGGGYGGVGGNGSVGVGGNIYGNATNVTQMGSAGGGYPSGCGGSATGGAGGGYVKINATGTINIIGSINAVGKDGPASYAGAGSGGGIWLITSTITGNGTLNASGGTGSSGESGYDGGGGGGGRIYIQYALNLSTIITSVLGGTSLKSGSAGSVYWSAVDTLGPSIDIVYPVDYQSFNYKTGININFTRSDATSVDTCWWSNSSGVANYTLNSGANISVSESVDGTYKVYIWCNDTINNVGSSSINYIVSQDAPAITTNFPTNNQYLNYKNNIYFNFTATDSNGLSTCELWGNWTGIWHKNYTWISPNSGVMNYTILNLTNGKYKYNVWCNDTTNTATFSSINRTFTIDTIYPLINITTLTTTAGSQTISFDFVNTEINPSSCKYSIFNSSTGIDGLYNNISITCGAFGTSATVSSYATYNLTIYSIDLAGNENSSTRTFTTTSSGGSTPSGGGGGGTVNITVEKVSVFALFSPFNNSLLSEVQRAILYKEIYGLKKTVLGTFSITMSNEQLLELKTKLESKGIYVSIEELRSWIEQYELGKRDTVSVNKEDSDLYKLILATGTYCGDGVCQKEFPGNDLGTVENFYNCNQDCPSFNVDSTVFYCFDSDEETECIWDQLTAKYVGLFVGLIFAILSFSTVQEPKTKKQVPFLVYTSKRLSNKFNKNRR